MSDRITAKEAPVFSTVQSEEVSAATTSATLELLHRLFPYVTEMKGLSGNKDRAPEIYDAVAGTKRLRISPAPVGPAKEANLAHIRDMVEEGAPISVGALYGTAKFPRWAERNVADLADFAALQAIAELGRRVEAVYEPGMQSRYYYEDVGGLWLFGEGAAASQEAYFESLQPMIRSAKGLYIVRESDMLREKGLGQDELQNRAEVMKPIFAEYFTDSETVMADFLASTPYETWDEAKNALGEGYSEFWETFVETEIASLKSYQKLIDTGWQGPIPPEMRAFYLQRFRRNLNNAGNILDTPEGRLDHMAHYFALVAAKAQAGLFTTEMPEDTIHGYDAAKALKLSFVKLAPGIPVDFQHVFQSRVYPKPGRSDRNGLSVDTTIPPWRGVGGVLRRQDGTVRAHLTAASEHTEHDVTPSMTAELTAGGSVHIPLYIRD